jgi:uncharacterized alkaline shock family protein YloU
VSERALAKIAAGAAAENHRLTGMPSASATVAGRIATVRLALAVRYPSPLPRVAAQIREHVRRRVRELTGIAVENLDIDITRLVPASECPRPPDTTAETPAGGAAGGPVQVR